MLRVDILRLHSLLATLITLFITNCNYSADVEQTYELPMSSTALKMSTRSSCDTEDPIYDNDNVVPARPNEAYGTIIAGTHKHSMKYVDYCIITRLYELIIHVYRSTGDMSSSVSMKRDVLGRCIIII